MYYVFKTLQCRLFSQRRIFPAQGAITQMSGSSVILISSRILPLGFHKLLGPPCVDKTLQMAARHPGCMPECGTACWGWPCRSGAGRRCSQGNKAVGGHVLHPCQIPELVAQGCGNASVPHRGHSALPGHGDHCPSEGGRLGHKTYHGSCLARQDIICSWESQQPCFKDTQVALRGGTGGKEFRHPAKQRQPGIRVAFSKADLPPWSSLQMTEASANIFTKTAERL